MEMYKLSTDMCRLEDISFDGFSPIPNTEETCCAVCGKSSDEDPVMDMERTPAENEANPEQGE